MSFVNVEISNEIVGRTLLSYCSIKSKTISIIKHLIFFVLLFKLFNYTFKPIKSLIPDPLFLLTNGMNSRKYHRPISTYTSSQPAALRSLISQNFVGKATVTIKLCMQLSCQIDRSERISFMIIIHGLKQNRCIDDDCYSVDVALQKTLKSACKKE